MEVFYLSAARNKGKGKEVYYIILSLTLIGKIHLFAGVVYFFKKGIKLCFRDTEEGMPQFAVPVFDI